MVSHYFAKTGKNPEQSLYQYAVGSNGVFVHAKRDNLEACIPVFEMSGKQKIRGLEEVSPFVKISEIVRLGVFVQLLAEFIKASPGEEVFYGHCTLLRWIFLKPAQVGALSFVKPINPYPLEAEDAIIEIHSHGCSRAFFSATDNRDETGFRIYGVIGNLVKGKWPEILVRVGIFGHYHFVPAKTIFELPEVVYDRYHDFNGLH